MKLVIIHGRTIKYKIFDKLNVEQSDFSCTDQNTDNLKIVTLITCDSINDNYRNIVKAKEVKS